MECESNEIVVAQFSGQQLKWVENEKIAYNTRILGTLPKEWKGIFGVCENKIYNT